MARPLPFRIARSFQRQCIFAQSSSRQFSSSARLAIDPQHAMVKPRSDTRQSPRTAMPGNPAEMLTNDMGLLPGTLVRPRGDKRSMPSLFREFPKRIPLEWKLLKTRFADTITRIQYKFFIRKGKPRPKLSRKQAIAAAKNLHSRMFSAYAEKNEQLLKGICTDGLLKSMRTRLAARERNEYKSWRIIEYLSMPRIVSNRATALPLPGLKETAIRQVVVRIHSKQEVVTCTNEEAIEELRKKLDNIKKSGKPLRGNLKELDAELQNASKGDRIMEPTLRRIIQATRGEEGALLGGKRTVEDKVEYVVVQRRMVQGTEERWKLWGFARETDAAIAREEEAKIQRLQAWEVRNQKSLA